MESPIIIRESTTEQDLGNNKAPVCAGAVRCRPLRFYQNGREIGSAAPVLWEDSCFVREYDIAPGSRDKETARACAGALLDWVKEQGARYAELCCDSGEERRFWESVGFVGNGADEQGRPLLVRPLSEERRVTVELLTDPEDRQLRRLENRFKKSIGEQALTEEGFRRLRQAVHEDRITFFIARRGRRAVGLCSIARCYSTFACSDTGVYEDFYIEPAFRGQGIARKLARAAQAWCRQNGMASVTVCCAPCDEALYRALGFDAALGVTLAHIEP